VIVIALTDHSQTITHSNTMKYHQLIVVTLPRGEAMVIVHQGNPELPQGTLQHLQLNFMSYSTADMVKRIIMSEGIRDFIKNNFEVAEYVQALYVSTNVLSSEEALLAVKEATYPTPKKKTTERERERQKEEREKKKEERKEDRERKKEERKVDDSRKNGGI